jgi:hypothetical protein
MRTGLVDEVCVLIPRSFQQFFGADDATSGGDEDLEHRELFPGERDVAVVVVNLPAKGIQTQGEGRTARLCPVRRLSRHLAVINP